MQNTGSDGDREAIRLGVQWARACLALELSDDMRRVVAETTRNMTLLLDQRSRSSDSR